jgi:elongation factor P hydroxylase
MANDASQVNKARVFAAYAEHDLATWKLAIGQPVEHVTLGYGIIADARDADDLSSVSIFVLFDRVELPRLGGQ